jgi:hypothetical protein
MFDETALEEEVLPMKLNIFDEEVVPAIDGEIEKLFLDAVFG